MRIFRKFYPEYIYKSVWDIEEGFFERNKIKYAVLDIDNTLVPYTVEIPTKAAIDFLDRLEREGVKYCFLSNNQEERVMKFNRDIKAVFISKARKPLIGGMKNIMHIIGAVPQNTIVIGDQIFTDVYTGKRVGAHTMLVEPIDDKETLFFKFKRFWERVILKQYRKEMSDV